MRWVAFWVSAGRGTFEWTFSQPEVPAPYTMGLRDVRYHLLTETPDVVQVATGTTLGGPLWDRPFFIAGISALGPVSYHAVQFTVDTPGLYRIESVVNAAVNFNYVYRNGFDAGQPLSNLLDYGLGNGNAPNGSPAGTSLIDVLLLDGETYTYVTSQWSATSPALPFTTTITGPDDFVAVCVSCPLGDFDGDSFIDADDQAFLFDGLNGPDNAPKPTLTGATPEQVLIAFDGDEDGDLDMADYAGFATAGTN
jgi:hypothetical protein